ncbi:hypothetical protein H9P43_008828 [Blastocladiella emersonii ATCC 22665]|nr:hypothetical protein H9P43_008828 [Blastocladiella emersonii ATCC 22665]
MPQFDVPLHHEDSAVVENGTRVTLLGHAASDVESDLTLVTNLPLPWLDSASPRPILYFEVTIAAMEPQTTVAVGLTTVPWPSFRLPGWNSWSVGYHSDDGRAFVCDDRFGANYGKPYRFDDVIGVGVNTADASVFFTRNGVKLAKFRWQAANDASLPAGFALDALPRYQARAEAV